ESLVIETDAPVLAPQSHRGRRNEPSYLRETAERVAVLRGVSLDVLANQTNANAHRLFRLPHEADSQAAVESVSA
ncbi:MAG: TatD family hydrolase, partial [Dehalococcoidia bacterium]